MGNSLVQKLRGHGSLVAFQVLGLRKIKKTTFKLHTSTPIKNNKGGSVNIALQSDLGVSPIFGVKSEKPDKTTDSEFAIESSHENSQQLYSSDELEASMSEKSDTDGTMSDDNNEETENAVGKANSVHVPEVLSSELNCEKSMNSDGDIDSGAKDMEKGTTTLKSLDSDVATVPGNEVQHQESTNSAQNSSETLTSESLVQLTQLVESVGKDDENMCSPEEKTHHPDTEAAALHQDTECGDSTEYSKDSDATQLVEKSVTDVDATASGFPSENNPDKTQSASSVGDIEKKEDEGQEEHPATDVLSSSSPTDGDKTETGKYSNTSAAQSETEDGKEIIGPSQETKCLGMGGPAKKKKKISIKLHDISEDSGMEQAFRKSGISFLQTPTARGVKYACNKCTNNFHTIAGYNTHLFGAHKIRDTSNHPPFVILPPDEKVDLKKLDESAKKDVQKDGITEKADTHNNKSNVNNSKDTEESANLHILCQDCKKVFTTCAELRAHYDECGTTISDVNSEPSPPSPPRSCLRKKKKTVISKPRM